MFEFHLPDVGEGVAEGEVVAWHVEPGDEVEADEVVAEVETDKAVVDLPIPVAGTVVERRAEVGDVVPVGDVLVTIDPAEEADADGGAGASDPDGRDAEATTVDDPGQTSAGESAGEGAGEDTGESAEVAPTAAGRVFAPPHVRRLARELGVAIGAVEGSGPGGRVTEADVREAAGAGGADDADVADAITQVSPDEEVTEEATAQEGEAAGSGRRSAIRRIEDRGDGESASAAGRERTLAAPATRQRADELGVDIDAVPTDKSRHGEAFVEPEDVEAYAETAQVSAAETEGSGRPADVSGGSAAERERRGSETREPYRGVRRTIGEQMAESAFTAPHVTHHDTAVVTALVETREAMKPRAEARGVSLTYVPFVLKAVVAGLREYPILNSRLDEEADEIVVQHDYDLGVATATDAGLMVPVVRDVDEKGLFELAAEVNDLATRARDRSITREEMQGGTFTVTNFGAIGGEYATPIINYPETAILGLGAIEQRPAVVDSGTTSSSRTASGGTASGELAAAPTLPLSLSIDHRVVDGAEAARFTNAVIEYLETPSLLMLE